MELIQFDKEDYLALRHNLLIIPQAYISGNRRAHLASLRLAYSYGKLELKTVRSNIKYFKKLLSEISDNALNENAKCLAQIIDILEKYVNK